MSAPSALTNKQWKKVATAVVFAFASAFLGVVFLNGGISSSYEANLTLLVSGTIAGINAAGYALFLVFKTDTAGRN